MSRIALRAAAVFVAFVVALTITSAAWADRAVLDPDGLTWWEQIIAWFSGDAPSISATIDPNG